MHYASIREAILGVIPHPSYPLVLHEPSFAGNCNAYVGRCIDEGWVSYAGSFVSEFDRKLATFCGTTDAISVVSGTAALHLAFLLAGVQPGDEVLIPSLTFIATANAVHYCGAIPHFVESNEQDLGIDVAKLRAYLADITQSGPGNTLINKQTGRTIRALVPVHIFGHPCDMDGLLALAADYNLQIVEDAAESLGSYYKGKHTGSFAPISILSFNGNKILTTGGGGAILTRDPAIAARARHLSTTAKQAHPWEFIHDEVGFNYRLPNLNAALGCAQMEYLPDTLQKKRALAAQYQAAFADIPGVTFVNEPAGTTSNFWLNTILLDPAAAEHKQGILEDLYAHKIFCRGIWKPMHMLPMHQSMPRMHLAVAENLYERIINLPSSPFLAHKP